MVCVLIKPSNTTLTTTIRNKFMDENFGFVNTASLDQAPESRAEKVRIKVNQRTGRKFITLLEGMSHFVGEDRIKKLVSEIKKKFATSASLVLDKKFGKVIQIQGDLRVELKKFLLNSKYCREQDIDIRGF